MRASTALRAPAPSATIVITAPTPMMMPSIVSSERSLFARTAWNATRTISSISIGSPLSRPPERWWLLLAHAGEHPAARPCLRFLLLLVEVVDQPGGRQHQHGVAVRHAAQHLGVVEVGETDQDVHRRRPSIAQHEGHPRLGPGGVGGLRVRRG